MGLFRALLLAATKLPLEKLLVKRSTPEVQLEKLRALTERRQASSPSELSKAPSNALSNNPDLSLQRFDTLKDPSLLENSNKVAVRNSVRTISNEETISYQKREVAKEMLLLEKHLQQKCKMLGKACDCCKKHLLPLESRESTSLQ